MSKQESVTDSMRLLIIRCLALMSTLGIMGMIRGHRLAMAQMDEMQPAAATSTESNETQIARALSAAPPDIAKDATVAEMDSKGNMTILRDGTNDFTWMPGDPKGIGQPAMCQDKASMQWSDDFRNHRPKPTNTFQASPTCSPVQRKAATSIHTIRQARLSRSARTG